MGRRKPAYATNGLPKENNPGINLGNNLETDKQQHEQHNNDGNQQQPIVHYMSFSTLNNANNKYNIINNPLYDLLQ